MVRLGRHFASIRKGLWKVERSVPVLVVMICFDIFASGFEELLVLDSVVDTVVVDVAIVRCDNLDWQPGYLVLLCLGV